MRFIVVWFYKFSYVFPLVRNSAVCNPAIVLLNLKADEVPVRAYGGYRRRAGTDAVVQNDIALVGVGAYQVFDQCDRLLCRVVERSFPVLFRNADHRRRILVVRHSHGRHLHLPVAAVGELGGCAAAMVAPLRQARSHLRMIDRLMPVEDNDVFVLAQRHPVGVEMSRYTVFLPHEVVTPQCGLGENQLRRKQPLRKQDNRTVGLGDSAVLLPQRFERNRLVPLCRVIPAVQSSIGKVCNDSIDAGVGHPAHTVYAIHVIYAVCLYHRSYTDFSFHVR